MIKVKNIQTVRDTRGNIKGYVIEAITVEINI